MKDRSSLYVTLVAVLISIIGLTVAYAALSTNLTITTGNVKQNALTWNVGFDTTSTTVAATAAGTSATGRTCGDATVAAGAVTIADTTLSKPGDACTWALTVKNAGDIAATLSSANGTAPSGVTCGTNTTGKMVCGNITYTLTSDAAGSTIITTGTTLNSKASQAVYLKAEYTGTTLNATAVTQTGAKFTLVYGQK